MSRLRYALYLADEWAMRLLLGDDPLVAITATYTRARTEQEALTAAMRACDT